MSAFHDRDSEFMIAATDTGDANLASFAKLHKNLLVLSLVDIVHDVKAQRLKLALSPASCTGARTMSQSVRHSGRTTVTAFATRDASFLRLQ